VNKETLLKYKSELVLILITVFWGATFIIVKKSLLQTSPALFLASRFTISTIVLLPIFIKYKTQITVNVFRKSLILGFLLWLGMFLQTIGLQYTSATKSGFFTNTSVIFIPIFQLIIEKRRPTNGTLLGIFFVIIGILFLSSGGNSVFTFLQDISKNFNFGDFVTLLSAIPFALFIVLLDNYSKSVNMWLLVFLQIVTVAIFSILIAIIFQVTNYEIVKISFTKEFVISILYLSIIGTVFNTILMTKFQKNVTPAKAGIIYSFEPVFAALFAFIFADERISTFGYFGGVLIFLGLIISESYENISEKWKARKLEQR